MPQITITANGTNTFQTTMGKQYAFKAAGTFGGGTVSLQWTDGTNDVEYPDGSFTADGAVEFLAIGSPTKVVLSGATTPSIITDVIPVSYRS
jgi:hypothetical protein